MAHTTDTRTQNLVWPALVILALGFAGGAIAVSLRFDIAKALFEFVLEPAGSAALLLAEDPLSGVLFPLRLFGLGFVSLVACGSTAYLIAGSRGKVATFLCVISASVLVGVSAFGIYGSYLQQTSDMKLSNGQTVTQTRGHMTRLSDVPVFKLGVLGPLLVCAGALALRRKRLIETISAL
jgi:hypothetical protein